MILCYCGIIHGWKIFKPQRVPDTLTFEYYDGRERYSVPMDSKFSPAYITSSAYWFNHTFDRFERILKIGVPYGRTAHMRVVSGMPTEPYLSKNINFILDELENNYIIIRKNRGYIYRK